MSSGDKVKPQGGHMGHGNAMGKPVEKAKDFKGTLKRLIGYLKPQRKKFILVFALAILATVFNVFGPKIMGEATNILIDGLMKKGRYFMDLQKAKELGDMAALQRLSSIPVPEVNFNKIWSIIVFLIVLYVLGSVFNFIMGYIMSGVSQNTVYKMRNDVNNKLSILPLEYFDGRTNGEILSRITNDLDNVGNTLQQSLTQLITSMVTIVGVIVMMLSISPTMTLVALITLPLSAIITIFIAKKSQKFFSEQQSSLGELNGHVEEMYTGHKVVKVFGHEEKAIDEFKKINEELYEAGWRAQFVSGIIMPLLNFISNLGYVFICVIGGFLVTNGRIQIGDVQSFIQYARQFTHPIIQTANIANVIQSTVASAERVFEVLDEEEEIADSPNAKVIEKPNGEVVFDHVKFGYTEDAILIKDMNMNVNPGETIAIVGPTGAGKTTLINLLMRFYEVNDGKILIDGIDIRDISRENLRAMFGMVLQDTWLFNGTIRDNIGYGKEGATETEIVAAAKAAHANHFIRTLPKGYDTILNEEASNISQGQKQLLTIARAILANPSIMILDEATSSVDTRTEIYIQKAMNELMKGRTSFVIAHRLSTIKNANLILVMNKGNVIESGTHEELLKKGGFYAELYNSQFAKNNTEEAL